ncbi:MAG: 30S ribosomal protein S20 [Pseudomonadota bacterium]
MANTTSAQKMVRKITRRTAVNKSRRSRVRTYVKKFEAAVEAGDREASQAALRTVESEMMRAVSKGVIHKNTASRKVSRLSKRIRDLSA